MNIDEGVSCPDLNEIGCQRRSDDCEWNYGCITRFYRVYPFGDD